MSIRLLHSFVEPILGCTSFILTCSCWEVTRLQHLHKSQVERTAVCAPGSECAERQPKSSVLAELIFGGCKMDIYIWHFRGKGNPKTQPKKLFGLLSCPSSISHHYMVPTFTLPSMKWIWCPLISSLNLLLSIYMN